MSLNFDSPSHEDKFIVHFILITNIGKLTQNLMKVLQLLKALLKGWQLLRIRLRNAICCSLLLVGYVWGYLCFLAFLHVFTIHFEESAKCSVAFLTIN